MTNEEMVETIRTAMADWNNLTDEQRAEATAIAAEMAAKRYTEVLVNRALGFELDWPTGEFKKAR